MEDLDSLYILLKDKVVFGNNLILQLKPVEEIDGVSKLQRKIKQEIKFLEKVLKLRCPKTEHLQCSNLNYLSAIVKCVLRGQNVTHVDYPVLCGNRKIHIDVISNSGNSWTKVVARNKRSLTEAVLGETSNNSRTILDQADDYLLAAKMHPNFFKIPQVIFEFTAGVDEFLKKELESRGIVAINVYENGQQNMVENMELCTMPLLNNVEILNLDVTTMLAYISNLSNGYCDFEFQEPLLSEQAKWERERPVNQVLDKLFVGKKLICCETAKKAFEEIVEVIGGSEEKLRAHNLLDRLQVMPDTGCSLKANTIDLVICGRIKQRSKIIFMFGHNLNAVTVTANEGFVRAAKQQGIEFAVYVHEPRALTEMKQLEK